MRAGYISGNGKPVAPRPLKGFKMAYFGFDVSKYQGNIDWQKIPSKYSFTVIRSGLGTVTSQKDIKFDINMSGAMKRGLNIGCYWFLYATTVAEAVQNAKAFLKVVEPYKGKINLPLYLDVEGDTIRYMRGQGVEPTKALISEMIRAFCKEIESSGYYVGVYSDNSFINSWFQPDILSTYDLWFAYWVTAFSPSYCIRNCGMWQYNNRGSIEGIAGNVDLCYTERNYPDIIKKAGLNHLSGSVEKPVESVEKTYTVEETETEIIIRLKK